MQAIAFSPPALIVSAFSVEGVRTCQEPLRAEESSLREPPSEINNYSVFKLARVDILLRDFFLQQIRDAIVVTD